MFGCTEQKLRGEGENGHGISGKGYVGARFENALVKQRRMCIMYEREDYACTTCKLKATHAEDRQANGQVSRVETSRLKLHQGVKRNECHQNFNKPPNFQNAT